VQFADQRDQAPLALPYRLIRGRGLRDAIAHAKDLAQAGPVELWAQHSDRLARGESQSVRHTVVIALWVPSTA
jgi:hypothetical protein